MMVIVVIVKLVLMIVGLWLLTLFGMITAPNLYEYGESELFPKAVKIVLRRYLLGGITAIFLAVFIPY